jgi:uncharacterized protein YuzE
MRALSRFSLYGLVSDPNLEHVCEEIGDEVVLMKDRSGKVIGFEKLNFTAGNQELLRLSFETSPA